MTPASGAVRVPQSPDLYRRAHNALLSEIFAVLPIDAVKSIDELPRDRTPENIFRRLNTEINTALADASIRARFAAVGAIVRGSPPKEFRSFIAEDTDKWAKVVRFAGIKIE